MISYDGDYTVASRAIAVSATLKIKKNRCDHILWADPAECLQGKFFMKNMMSSEKAGQQ